MQLSALEPLTRLPHSNDVTVITNVTQHQIVMDRSDGGIWHHRSDGSIALKHLASI